MIIQVKVKPNSRKEMIEQKNSIYIINLKENAEKGEANIALIKALARHFNVSSASIKIKSGMTSKNKTVEIVDK